MTKKYFVSWAQYTYYIDCLMEKIDFSKYKYIYGVPRGGLVFGVILSQKTNIPLRITLPEDEDHIKEYLIVDDIVDSGLTIEPFLKQGYDVVTIFKHESYKGHENLKYSALNHDWIVFPYECENDKVSDVTIKNINERRKQNS